MCAQPGLGNRQRGFTLVEMMIVVAVIGVISAIGASRFGSYLMRSRVSEAHLKLSQVHRAEEAFFANHSYFTTDLVALGVNRFSSPPHFIVGFANLGRAGAADHLNSYSSNSTENLKGVLPDEIDGVFCMRNSEGFPTEQHTDYERKRKEPVNSSWFTNGIPTAYLVAAVGNLDGDRALMKLAVENRDYGGGAERSVFSQSRQRVRGVISVVCDDGTNLKNPEWGSGAGREYVRCATER